LSGEEKGKSSSFWYKPFLGNGPLTTRYLRWPVK
jgi:hypothetical protein